MFCPDGPPSPGALRVYLRSFFTRAGSPLAGSRSEHRRARAVHGMLRFVPSLSAATNRPKKNEKGERSELGDELLQAALDSYGWTSRRSRKRLVVAPYTEVRRSSFACRRAAVGTVDQFQARAPTVIYSMDERERRRLAADSSFCTA